MVTDAQPLLLFVETACFIVGFFLLFIVVYCLLLLF